MGDLALRELTRETLADPAPGLGALRRLGRECRRAGVPFPNEAWLALARHGASLARVLLEEVNGACEGNPRRRLLGGRFGKRPGPIPWKTFSKWIQDWGKAGVNNRRVVWYHGARSRAQIDPAALVVLIPPGVSGLKLSFSPEGPLLPIFVLGFGVSAAGLPRTVWPEAFRDRPRDTYHDRVRTWALDASWAEDRVAITAADASVLA